MAIDRIVEREIMKLRILLTALPAIMALSACGQSAVKLSGQTENLAGRSGTEAPVDYVVYPDDRPSIPDGKLTYEKANCASCHGADGSTQTGTLMLNDPRWTAQQKPVDEYKFLAFGDEKKGHEAYRDKFSRRELWDLVFYSRSLAIAPLTAKEHADMTAVFGANCAVCHGTKGDGDGPLARNLEPWPANFQTFRRFYDRTDDVIFDHIANGIKWEGMPNFLGKEDRRNGVKFDHAYIRKLVQYIRAFHVSIEPHSGAELAKVTAEAAQEIKREQATSTSEQNEKD